MTFMVFSKDEATNFNADIANSNSFKSFNYKAKLVKTSQIKLMEF